MLSSGGTRPFGQTLAALVWWHGGRRSDTVMTADGPWSGAEHPAMRAIASPAPCHRRHTDRQLQARGEISAGPLHVVTAGPHVPLCRDRQLDACAGVDRAELPIAGAS